MAELISLTYSPEVTPDLHPWQDEAACLDEDPEIFFPDQGDVTTAIQAAECCEICPVREQCLQYAIDNQIDHGIFGGMSGRGRKELIHGHHEVRQANRKKVASMTGRHMTAREIADQLGISMRQVTRLRSKKVS